MYKNYVHFVNLTFTRRLPWTVSQCWHIIYSDIFSTYAIISNWYFVLLGICSSPSPNRACVVTLTFIWPWPYRYYLRFKDTYRQAAIDITHGKPVQEDILYGKFKVDKHILCLVTLLIWCAEIYLYFVRLGLLN